MLLNSTLPKSSYRLAAYTILTSGIIGILSFGFLIAFLVLRSPSPDTGAFMIQSHDAGVILQFILLIPFAIGLYAILHKRSNAMSRLNLCIGIVALFFTILFLILGSIKIISDTLYMFPQGLFGIWLITSNRLMLDILPRGLRRFGKVAGFGLMVAGTFPIAFAIFVDPVAGFGPIPKNYVDKDSIANLVAHIVLLIGTFMGVITFPIWSILIGRKLMRH